MITAKEYLNGLKSTIPIEDIMIDFTKLHCYEQAKVIAEKAKVELAKDWIRKEETIHHNSLVSSITVKVNRDSILNSYDLNLIK